MARKNGCPTNVRDWQVEILSRASTALTPLWLRIKGITSITISYDGETEDGSDAASLYSEPYVTKRSGSLSLEGKPVYDAVTGAQDLGQAELDYYATVGGCDADAQIRLTDPYGHAEIFTVAVTSKEVSADESEQTVSWDTEIVGEPEEVAYVQVDSIAVKDGSASAATVSLTKGSTKTLTVVFTPEGASNKKYSVASANSAKVRVKEVGAGDTPLNFKIEGVDTTTSAVDVVVRSMNNSEEFTCAVTVTAGT